MSKMLFSVIPLCIVFFNGCHKPCVAYHYAFKINNCIFQPGNDSIRVGDTLFFSSSSSTTMINQSDGRSIDYSSADNFGSILGVTQLIGLNTAIDAISAFSYIQVKGEIYTDNSISPNRVKQTKFVEENGYYKLSFNLVAQRRGIYLLGIADMPDVVKKCDRSAIKLEYSNSIDRHLHYLKDIYYGGGAINSLDSTHAYCVKVY